MGRATWRVEITRKNVKGLKTKTAMGHFHLKLPTGLSILEATSGT